MREELENHSHGHNIVIPISGTDIPVNQRTAIVYDDKMLLHHDPNDDDHPEEPCRLSYTMKVLTEEGILGRCMLLGLNELLPDYMIMAAHDRTLLQDLRLLTSLDTNAIKAHTELMDSIYFNQDSEMAARVAASCTVGAALAIANGIAKNGFALVRPPGHHAERDKPMGFCLFNNVAIAVRELQRQRLARRILIVDWDVHHGNGTQKILEGDPNIVLISLHRYDKGRFYPASHEAAPTYVGQSPALGNIVNISWNGERVGDIEYLAAFRDVILPIAEEFRPDFVFVSSGFDAAAGDPLGGYSLTPEGYFKMTRLLMQRTTSKILLVLEGGYSVENIASCTSSCIRALLGDDLVEDNFQPRRPSLEALDDIMQTIRAHGRFWKSLRPMIYEAPSPALSLQALTRTYWKDRCTNRHDLITLPVPEDIFHGFFLDQIYVSDNILTDARHIVLSAHESGIIYGGNMGNNVVDQQEGQFFMPWDDYIAEALQNRWSVIDICIPSRRWKLKQTQNDSVEGLRRLQELMIFLWDHFLSLNENSSIAIIASGLPSYAICNLIDKRAVEGKITSISIISPTQYLPIVVQEKAEWYKSISQVIVPSKKSEGSPISAAPIFGSCQSAGTDDPQDTNRVIHRSQGRIFQFIQNHLD